MFVNGKKFCKFWLLKSNVGLLCKDDLGDDVGDWWWRWFKSLYDYGYLNEGFV